MLALVHSHEAETAGPSLWGASELTRLAFAGAQDPSSLASPGHLAAIASLNSRTALAETETARGSDRVRPTSGPRESADEKGPHRKLGTSRYFASRHGGSVSGAVSLDGRRGVQIPWAGTLARREAQPCPPECGTCLPISGRTGPCRTWPGPQVPQTQGWGPTPEHPPAPCVLLGRLALEPLGRDCT